MGMRPPGGMNSMGSLGGMGPRGNSMPPLGNPSSSFQRPVRPSFPPLAKESQGAVFAKGMSDAMAFPKPPGLGSLGGGGGIGSGGFLGAGGGIGSGGLSGGGLGGLGSSAGAPSFAKGTG